MITAAAFLRVFAITHGQEVANSVARMLVYAGATDFAHVFLELKKLPKIIAEAYPQQ